MSDPRGPAAARSPSEQVNAAGEAELRAFLAACCDVHRWIAGVADARPYADDTALIETADRIARTFDATEVDRALAAHPRIGERAEGNSQSSRWSRTEQSSVSRDEDIAAELAEANRQYEQRFDRVFLICAAGLSAEEILAAAFRRLSNDDEAERSVVADELRKIALLRLKKGMNP